MGGSFLNTRDSIIIIAFHEGFCVNLMHVSDPL